MALIGILSTLDSPLLPGYLASLSNAGLKNFAVICDSKCLSSNQKKLFSDRLGGWSIAEYFGFDIHQDLPTTPFYFVDDHNSSSSIALIKTLGCLFLLNAGTPRKLSSHILNSTIDGVLNIHPGSLPSYRGKNCPEWAVLQGDKVIITAHIMDIEYDEGDVLGLLEVDWRPLKSYFEFRRQVYLKSFELASKVSLDLVESKASVLYNTHDSSQPSIIREVMSDELLRHVKNSFGMAN